VISLLSSILPLLRNGVFIRLKYSDDTDSNIFPAELIKVTKVFSRSGNETVL